MKEVRNYYQKNKAKYQKGGLYYKYIPVLDRDPKPVSILKGKFIISFN
tara:strand:- start:1210 stop:1353 length:144 start_codon:yes stop_codon:yes gene_type:complete